MDRQGGEGGCHDPGMVISEGSAGQEAAGSCVLEQIRRGDRPGEGEGEFCILRGRRGPGQPQGGPWGGRRRGSVSSRSRKGET